MCVTDTWRPKRPGPASDRDNVTRQTLRAGIHAPPPEKPYITHIGVVTGYGSTRYSIARTKSVPLHWVVHGSRFWGNPIKLTSRGKGKNRERRGGKRVFSVVLLLFCY